jgi:glycosyltransferase involved in cell wall biosynthesis
MDLKNPIEEQAIQQGRSLSILLSAYACEPDKGSEPGIGWKWARNLSMAGHRVYVITRENNRASIDDALTRNPMPGVSFAYYDLPKWARWWKKGGRGVHLYYFLWQWGAYLLARKICRLQRFDIVHHITFGVFRQPSFMAFLGLPFVFGPVGGGESAPYALRRSFPMRGKVTDFLRDVANRLVNIDPLMSAVYSRSGVVLCKTRETLNSIPERFREKCQLQLEIGTGEPGATRSLKGYVNSVQHADCDSSNTPSPLRGEGEMREIGSAVTLPSREGGFASVVGDQMGMLNDMNPSERRKPLRILYVGRLVYLKGVHLALPAFAHLHKQNPDARLTIVGSGPEEQRLKRLAIDLGVDHAIEWRSWLTQREVMQVYPQHDVFLFPSLHDSSGNAVLEALSFGLPVVCLNLGGPGVLVDDSSGFRVSGPDEQSVVSGLGRAMISLAEDDSLRRQMSISAFARANEHFSWSKQTERMCGIYTSLGVGTSLLATNVQT